MYKVWQFLKFMILSIQRTCICDLSMPGIPHKKINQCLTDINRCLTDISQF